MMESCLNVHADMNAPRDDHVDPVDRARRYNGDYDDDSASDREDEEEEERRRREKAAKQAEAESKIGAPELLAKLKQLTGKLTDKNREIDRLGCLLEAMEPIPGVDPDRLQRLYEERDRNAAAAGVKADSDLSVDYRDTKIVAMAKKVRNITMQLNKERATVGTCKQTAEEMRVKVDKLAKELEALQSPAARAAALRNTRADIKAQDSESDAAELRAQVAAAHRAVDEMKRRAAAAETENRKLHRALVRELGEGAAGSGTVGGKPPSGGDDGATSKLAAALDENSGWRGRAQQVQALKNKLRKVESDHALLQNALKQQQAGAGGSIGRGTGLSLGMGSIREDSELGGSSDDSTALTNAMRTYSGGTVASAAASYATGRGSNNTVDSKAADVLSAMSSDRQAAIESVITDRERLLAENEAAIKKTAALKSRIRNLEGESGKHKEQMKVLLDKTDSDDQLVELLKAEIARLKEQLRQVSEALKEKKAENDSFASNRVQHVKAGPGDRMGAAGGAQRARMVADSDALEKELSRVKRLVDQQSAQLDTQDEVIRKLRSSNAPGASGSTSNKSYY